MENNFVPARPTQTHSPIIQSILIIVFLVFFGWFVLIPKNNTVANKNSQLAELKTQKQNLDEDLIELNQLVLKLESSEKQVKLLDEALPLSSRPTQIAVLLESYARSSAMQISQINIDGMEKHASAGNTQVLPKPFEQSRKVETIPVSVSVNGTADQFKNFLTLLESSGRIIDVDSFSVVNSENVSKFSMRLITYAYETK